MRSSWASDTKFDSYADGATYTPYGSSSLDAQQILDDWRDFVGKFWLVKPKAADIGSLLVAIKAAA